MKQNELDTAEFDLTKVKKAIKRFEDEIDALKEEKEKISKAEFKTPELKALEDEKRGVLQRTYTSFPKYREILDKLNEANSMTPNTAYRMQQIKNLQKEKVDMMERINTHNREKTQELERQIASIQLTSEEQKEFFEKNKSTKVDTISARIEF